MNPNDIYSPQPSDLSQWRVQDIIPKNYNNQQPPVFDGQPVSVDISLSILTFRKISEADQSFSIDVFMHEAWTDKRLNLPVGFNSSQRLILGSQWISQIWIPSLNFRNARSVSVFQSLAPTVYATLNNESQIYLSAKLSLDLNCNMHMSKYPFDTQRCNVEIGARKYSQLFDVTISH